VHLVRSVRRRSEHAVEGTLIRRIARCERRVDVLVLERRQVSGVLGSNDGELALK